MVEELSRSKPKARKDHICSYCLCKINKGETYNYSRNIFDGDIYPWKSHLKCATLVSELSMMDYSDGYGIGEEIFKHCVDEKFDEIWREKDEHHYESKDFVIPTTKEKVDFIINYLTQPNNKRQEI